MAMAISNSGYQQGTTAAPQKARSILAAIAPQVEGLAATPGQLVTPFATANSNSVYTAKVGASTNSNITIAYVVAGANTPLTVSVTGNAITVNVATTAGSAASSTAAQVNAAVNANGPASALVTAALPPTSDGTGVVSALAATPLGGGRDKAVGGESNAPLPSIPPIHNVYNTR